MIIGNIETATGDKTQNKTRKENSANAVANSEKAKLIARKSFSAVKNLPDAERL
jgi:hypothetical protein